MEIKINRENLICVLSEIFNLEDTFDYRLTRVKEATEYGTLTIDDFVEYNKETVAGIADCILEKESDILNVH